MDFIQKFKIFLLLQKPVPSKATVKNYVVDVKHFIAWYEAFLSRSFNPDDVTAATIAEFKRQKASSYSIRSIERHISSLKKFFHALKLQSIISESPFDVLNETNKQVNQDPWHLKEFKDYLYVYNASHLTIKNYIIDVKQFLHWAEQVSHIKDTAKISERNVFGIISNPLLEEYKARLGQEGGFSASSINRKLSSLRKYLNWANQQGLIQIQIAIPDNLNNAQIIDSAHQERVPEKDVNIYPNESSDDSRVMSDEKNNSAHNQSPITHYYSSFPPLRLIQKIGKGLDVAVEAALIAPLTHLFVFVHKQVWKIQGKPLFADVKKVSNQNWKLEIGNWKLPLVKNLPKAMYAPHAISVKYFPWYRKAIYHVRYSRPRWYRRYHQMALAHYFNWAVLIVFCTAIGFGMYNSFVTKPKEAPTLAATAPPRILSFQGRLTDSSDTPITASTNLRFAIYSDPTSSGSALLWQEVDGVTPDKNGVFSVLLGKGTTIPQSLFANNQSLYLGITVGNTPELTPRQQLATVAYAANSETLQGMPPITQSGAGTQNVILALDSSGNLSIGASTTFQSTSGSFTVAGNTVAFSTNSGSNGNITFAPDGTGTIDLQKPLQNSTLNNNIGSNLGAVEVDDLFAVLATSAASATIINQDGTGALISASSSGSTKFVVGNAGDITSANYTSNGGVLYTDGTGLFLQTSAGSLGECLTSNGGGAPSWAACGSGTNFWTLDATSGTLYPINTTLDVFFGGTSTSSANFAFINNAPSSGTPTASISGNLTLNSAGKIQTTNNQSLTIGGSTTGNIILSPLNGLGNVTIAGLTTGIVHSNNSGVITSSALNLAGGATEITGVLPLANGGTNNNLTPSNGGIVYSDATKLQILGASATVGQCLLSGGSGAPGWGNCTVGGGNNWWNMNLGTLFPVNTTLDLVLGGTGTASAKFAVLNIANGTPTASISSGLNGSGVYVAANGVIQTTNNQGLTLGGSTTGNIILSPLNGNGTVTINGKVSSSLIPAVSNTYDLGSSSLEWNNLYVKNLITTGSISGFFQRNLGVISPTNITDDFAIGGNSTSSAKFQIFGNTGNATTAGTLTFDGTGSLIQTTRNQDLTIGGDTTGNITLSPLNGNGTVTINGQVASNLIPSANNTFDLGSPTLEWRNIFASGNFAGFWQRFLGIVSPSSSTDDLAVGGTSTSSAKFQIFGNTGNATTAGSLTFNGNGQIQTTNNSALTLGGSTTGNIIISPLNGSGNVTITGLGTGVVQSTSGVLSVSAVNLTSEVTGTLPIANGGTNTGSLGAAGSVAYSNGTSYAFTGIGSSGDCLVSNGSGTPVWTSCSAAAANNYWNLDNGLGDLYPLNSTLDVFFGGTSTSSANFAFINNAPGSGTPTASISGNLTLNSAGIIQTTNNQPLTIGGNTTGGITLSPNNGSGIITLNSPTIQTTQTNVNLFNSTATTLNIGGAADINLSTAGKTTSINGNLTVAGTSNLNGNVNVGDTSGDQINVAGRFISSLIPNTNNTYDLGSPGLAWDNLYVDNIISSGNLSGFWQRFSGVLSPQNITDDLAIGGTATGAAKFQIFGNTGNATTAGTLTFNGNGQIQTTNNSPFTLGGDSTGNIILSPNNGNGIITLSSPTIQTTQASLNLFNTTATTINFGGAATTANLTTNATTLHLADGAASNTLSIGGAAGTTTVNNALTTTGVFTANNTANLNGNINLGNASSDIITAAGRFGSSLIPNQTDTYDLGSSSLEWNNLYVKNIISGGTFSGFWQRFLGVLSPTNSTDDLAVGGTATNSAKFQIFGNTGNATTAGTLTFNGNGQIQTTNNSPLTLGGSSTGNIILSPNNGTGSVTINGTFNSSLVPTTNNTYNLGSPSLAWNNLYVNNIISSGAISGFLQRQLGVLSPANITDDLALGGTSTSSALFQIFGNTGNATTAGTLTFNGTGSLIQTTNFQPLTLGGNTTGPIQLSPKGTTGLYVDGTGNVGINTSAPLEKLSVNGNASVSGNLTFDSAASIQTTNNNGLTIGGASTGNIILSPLNGNGTVTINTNKLVTTASNFDLFNTTATTINFGGTADINLSTAGKTTSVNGDLTVVGTSNLNGNVNLGDTAGDTITVDGEFGSSLVPHTDGAFDLGTPSLEWNNLYVKNIISGGTISGFFQKSNNVIAPLNISDDLAIGGVSTSAAKFQIFGTSGNATTTGTLTFTSGGSQIQTTSNLPLTLGGNTTGSIILSPNNGNGIITLNSPTIQTTQTSLNLFNTTATTITFGGAADINLSTSGKTTSVNGDLTVAGTSNLNGNVNLGDANTDLINPVGVFAGSIIPQSTSINLGSNTNFFGSAFITNVFTSASSNFQGFWQRFLGVVSPTNSTDDLAIGGTSTASAKFQIFGNTGNATTAGNLTFNGNGQIQTTSNQPLTLGGDSTGNIILSPNNGTGSVTINGTVNSNLIPTTTDAYDLGSPSLEWNNLYVKNIITDGTLLGAWQRNLGVLAPLNITDDLAIGGTATNSAKFQIFGLTGNATSTGTLTFTGGDSNNVIATRNNQGLTIGDSQTGNITITALNGSVGSTIALNAANITTTQTALNLFNTTATTLTFGGAVTTANITTAATTLHIADSAVTNTVSIGGTAGGTTTVNNNFAVTGITNLNGNVTLGDATSDTITPTGVFATSLLPQSTTVNLGGTSNYYGSAYITNLFPATGSNYEGFLQRFNGVISPTNITDDLAIGGTATSTAKFQIFGLTGNATTAGNLTFTGNGNIQTTNNSPLTLGGDSTGNIILKPNNGTGSITVNGTFNSSLIPTASNTYDLGSNSLQWNTVFAHNVVVDGQALTQLFQRNQGVISPLNITDDLAIGNNATSTAKFQIFGLTGNATTAGSLTFNGGSASNVIATRNNQGLTIGDSQTGNITITALNGGAGSIIALNAANITTTQTSLNLFNTTATTINFGGAADINLSTAGKTTSINGNLTVAGTSNLNGNVNVGDTSGDQITVAGRFISSLIPNTNNTYDLGSNVGPLQWNNIYGHNFYQDGSPIIASWQRNLGVLAPLNITDDVAVGGTATSSAKFQIFGLTGNATTAGTLTFDGTGSLIQTTKNQSLTIGGNTTGSITLSPNNGSGTVSLAAATIALTGTNPTITTTSNNTLSVLAGTGTITLGTNSTGGDIQFFSSANKLTNTGNLTIAGTATVNGTGASFIGGRLGIGVNPAIATALDVEKDSLGNAALLVANLNTAGDLITASNSAATQFTVTNSGIIKAHSFQDLDNTSYLLDPASTNNSLLVAGSVGIGTTSPLLLSGLDIEKNAQGNAALVVANLNTAGDLITASNSAGTKFTIQNDGTIKDARYTTGGGILFGTSTGVFTQTAAGNLGQCLTSTAGGTPQWADCATGAAGSNWWTMSNGSVYPINTTFDLFVGGSATASAKFAVLNMTGSGTPTASVSSGLNGTSTFITADGTLQTSRFANLTIGGATTGDIILTPHNANGNVMVNAGTLDTTSTIFNLLPSATTTLNIGATSGTINLKAPTVDDTQSSVTLFGTPTTINFGGAATTLNLGKSGGTSTVLGDFAGNGNTTLGTNASNTIVLNGLVTGAGANNAVQPGGASGTTDLGSASHFWATVYANNFISPVSGGTAGFWQLTSNVLSPVNAWNDLAVGGNATSSATPWQVFATTVGVNTAGTATSSGGLSFRGTTTNINLLNGSVLKIGTSVGGDEGLTGNTKLELDNNGDLTLGGANIVTTQGTVNLFNTTATTINFGGGASAAINVGNASGTTTLRGNLVLGSSATNTIFPNAKFSASIIPTSNSINLGSPTNNFGDVYATNLYIAGNYAGFWQRFTNVVSPANISDDLAIGGTSTSSAKFQIFGTSGNATTAGTLTFNAAGNLIQTTNFQPLAIGGNSTGTIQLSPKGLTGFYLDGAGNTGIGTTAPTAVLDVVGTASISSTLTFRGGAGTIQATSNNLLTLGGNTTGAISFGSNVASSIIPAGTDSFNLGSDPTLGGKEWDTLYVRQIISPVGGGIAGFWQLNNGAIAPANISNDLLVGGVATSSATFHIFGASTLQGTNPVASISAHTAYAGLVVDNTVGDLITASSSGLSRFVVNQSGNVGIGSGATNPLAALDISSLAGKDDLLINQASATNLVPNPSFENSSSRTTSWTLSATAQLTTTNATESAMFGGNALRFYNMGPTATYTATTSCIAVTSGSTYTASAYVYRVSGFGGNAGIDVQTFTNGSCSAGQATAGRVNATTNDQWTRVSTTISTSGISSVEIRFISDGSNTGRAYADGFQLEKASIASPYLDGSFGPGYYWTGAPNNSSSVRTVGASYAYQMFNSAGGIGAASRNQFPTLQLDQNGTGDIFTASVSGITKFALTNNGYVGIGAYPTPGVALDIEQTAPNVAFMLNQLSSGSDILTASASGTTRLQLTNGGILRSNSFQDLDDTRYFLDPAASAVALNISGTASTAAGLTFAGAGTTHNVYTLDNGNLDFQMSPGGSVPTTGIVHALYLQGSTGRVGIGTTNPFTSLEVASKSASTEMIGSPNNPAILVHNTNSAAFNEKAELQFSVGNNKSPNAAITALYTDFASGGGPAGLAGADLAFSTKTATGLLTEAMRIKNNGNVGIGTTNPSSPLHIGDDSTSTADLLIGGGTNVGNFLSVSGARATFGYDGSNAVVSGGTTKGIGFFVNAGTFGGGTEAMFINSSGNVGIGTTSPGAKLDLTSATSGITLQIGRASGQPTIKANSDYNGYLIMDSYGGGAGVAALNWYSSDDVILANGGGKVGIGTTSPTTNFEVLGNKSGSGTQGSNYIAQIYNTGGSGWSGVLQLRYGETPGGGASNWIQFRDGGNTQRGSITGNGGGTTYNTTSDRRIKTDITDTSYGLQDVLKIPVRNFEYTSDPNHTVQTGFIAQELYPIYPDAVSTNGDNGITPLTPGEIPWQVDYSKLTPLLVKGIQDLDIKVGTNYASLSATMANVNLTQTGDIALNDTQPSADFTTPHYYTLSDALGQPISQMGAFVELAVGNLRAGSVNAQQLLTNSLAVATTNISIAGQSLHDYIVSVVNDAINNGTIGQWNNGTVASPIASVDQLHTNLISPLASGSAVALSLDNSGISVKNTISQQTVARIDNTGNATFSGQLTSQNLAVNADATVSGTLHAHRIEADEIAGLSAAVGTLSAQNITNVTNIYFATPSAHTLASGNNIGSNGISSSPSGALTPFLGYANIASYSGFLSYVPNLDADTAMFSQGLMSLGSTSLSDTTINGQLAIGTQLILADNTLNVLGGTFQIQSLRQGDVTFEGGLIAIDTDGNLTVNGNAIFTKNLAANVISPLGNDRDLTIKLGDNSQASGSALATSNLQVQNASGSGIFNVDQLGNLIASGAASVGKLNINLVQPVLAVSDTEVVATGSAGTAAIKAHQTEVTIDNKLVTPKSLIYITPVGQTTYSPYLLRQVSGTSFTVGIPVDQYTDTTFNWLIVN